MFAGAASTDGRGIAADYWTLGTSTAQAQRVEVRAVLPNGQKQVFGVFTAAALPGPATQIAGNAGNGESAPVNTAVAIAPSVIVRDQFNNPVNGLTVTFAVATGGGSLTGGIQTTNGAGVATVGSWTLGPAVGTNTLTATAAGSGITGNPVSFTATAVAVFTAVSAGGGYTCGVTPGGVAHCWGVNFSGQLGDGTTNNRTSPVVVLGGLAFSSVSAGAYAHTCGLTTGGAAYCWGFNNDGELGDGTQNNRTSPVAVQGGLTFTTVSAANSHSCGVTTGGAAYCWGLNSVGQLGDGTTTPTLRTSPVAVLGGLTFAAVSAALAHTCGVTTGGAAYCWGKNDNGQLGDGTTTDRTSPVAVQGGRTFAVVSAGGDHTCGVTTGGAAYCWGKNDNGQLGDGTHTTTVRTSPVAVQGGLTFTTVSAGGSHTCGVTNGGAAYCWGSNFFGELGDGTTTLRASPVAVLGGLTFAALRASVYYHTCGVTTGGAAYCWGYNSLGQLGDGTTTDRHTPTPVAQP